MSTKSHIIWYEGGKKIQDVVKKRARGLSQGMKRRNGEREKRLKNAHKSGGFAHFPVQVYGNLMDDANLTN
jgi:hypothetical protein